MTPSTITSNEREMVKVMVCGITSSVDAEKAIEFGADFLGFNFYPHSPRCLTAEAAAAILARLPQTSRNVALFVNAPKTRVLEVISRGRAAARAYGCLQFHGEESEDYCRGWDLQVIKAVRMKEKNSLLDMKEFPADFFLLDSWSASYGGSGAAFPWEWLQGVNTEKLFLSGGLTLANVVEAIQRVRPYGVDVCSGVEARPGIKDHGKLKEFISAAKSA